MTQKILESERIISMSFIALEISFLPLVPTGRPGIAVSVGITGNFLFYRKNKMLRSWKQQNIVTQYNFPALDVRKLL